MGEPLRLMVDLPNESEIVDIIVHQSGMRLLVASDAGNGFVVPEDDVIARRPARANRCLTSVTGWPRYANGSTAIMLL